jgi:hypothetical protein
MRAEAREVCLVWWLISTIICNHISHLPKLYNSFCISFATGANVFFLRNYYNQDVSFNICPNLNPSALSILYGRSMCYCIFRLFFPYLLISPHSASTSEKKLRATRRYCLLHLYSDSLAIFSDDDWEFIHLQRAVAAELR